MNKLLVLGSLAVAALALAPNASAAIFAEVEGKWYWQTDGYVRFISGTGTPASAVIFVDDDGTFFYRVAFDPAGRTFAQCLNGEGFLSLNGPSVPLSSCSLDLQGNTAIPRASIDTSAGQLPGPVGRYLGEIGAGLSGSGSFRIA